MLSDQLGHIIHNQLCNQRLVVLPGFGGFVLDLIPSELDELRNRIHPPSETVIFNAKLDHNDGVLISTVAEDLELSYTQADNWVTDAISELRFRLENNETVNWKGVGTLKNSLEGQVEFTYNGDKALQGEVFGLKPLSLSIAEKDNVDKVRELVAADGPVVTAARTIPLKRIARYAAAAVTIGILAWIPFQKGMDGNGKMLVHQLNPFAVASEVSFSPRDYQENWLPKGLEKPDVLANRYEMEYLSLHLTEDNNPGIVVKTDAVPSQEVTPREALEVEQTETHPTSFVVIAASYPAKKDALKYVADMKKRGFGAEYAGTDESGHLVAYGSYDSLEDANSMLASVSISNKQARIVSGN